MSEKTTSIITPTEDILNISWHSIDSAKVLDNLNVPVETGLSEEEVKARLEKFGHNELAERPGKSFLQKLWEQINSFVIWLLIGAAVISAVLGDGLKLAQFC